MATKPLLTLTTPVGNTTFILTDFIGMEMISHLFSYQITTHSSNQEVSKEQLLYKSVTIQINTGSTVYYFNGIVSALETGSSQSDTMRQYSMTIVPDFWKLGLASNCAIFENQTAVDIIKSLLEKNDITYNADGLKGSYSVRDVCVQYQETTLHFVLRLLEEEGIFYFFRHEHDKNILVLADKNSAFTATADNTLSYRPDQSARDINVNYWNPVFKAYSGKITHADYNFETPATSLHVQSSAQASLPAAQQFEQFSYPGKYLASGIGQGIASRGFTSMEAAYQHISGASNYAGLHDGSLFTLTDHPDASQNGDYFITSISHLARDQSQLGGSTPDSSGGQYYGNTFTCLPAQVTYQSLRKIEKPYISGHQTATVIGSDGAKGQEISLDNYGRVAVQFHWDREEKSAGRIRVAQNLAGAGYGAAFFPRIGQEVVVAFENGDPDRPVVVGSVNNPNQMPSYALPDQMTKSGIKTRSSKGGSSSEFNELSFDDKKGQELIYLHAQKDLQRDIENSETTTIKKGDQTINVSAGKSTLQATDSIVLQVGNNQLEINTQGVYLNGAEVKLN